MIQEKQKEIYMNKTILGIDLGVTSCGWCLLERDEQGNIVKFIDSGVRIFNSPKEPKGDTLKNAKRREKRLSRRNNLRKNRRTKKLINVLLEEGFLSPIYVSKENHKVELTHLINQELGDPFEIREKALNQKLSKDELSYAIIHLARRRGFRSSKKSLSNEEKKAQAEASEISEEMKKAQCRTIGEYINQKGQEPIEGKRGKYLLRPLIENELDEILSCQRSFGNLISEEFENKIKEIIFYQRPLKLQKDKIGYCTYEAKKRTTKYHTDAQKFVIFERIKNLKLIQDVANEKSRLLTDEESLKLLELLLNKKEMTFKEIKKKLNIPENHIFNFEKDSDKFKGNDILSLFTKSVADVYIKLSDKEKEELLNDMFTIFDEDAREKRLINQWEDKFNSEKFYEEIVNNKTTPKYLNMSLRACRRLLKEMLHNPDVKNSYDAKKLVYPDFYNKQKNETNKDKNFILKFDTTRNPTVDKAANQCRKIINEIIKTYGKPDQVNIELARDLKASKKQKIKMNKRNKERVKEKENFKKEIENHICKNFDSLPKNEQHELLDKIQLYYEPKNKGQVIYPVKTENGYEISSEAINLTDLLNDSQNKYEVDHIIPRAISMDDRLSNKIISLKSQNQFKLNRTPFDVWGADAKFYNEYFLFIKDQIPHKLKTFGLSTQDYIADNGFNTRHLNDTRYMSLFVKEQLEDYFEKVLTIKGGMTSIIRNMIGLKTKNRDNHLHHAEDAFIIAFSSEKTIKAAYDNLRQQKGRGIFKELIKSQVLTEFQTHLENIIVSHEQNQNIGEFLEDTKYGKRIVLNDKVVRENNKTKDLDKVDEFYVHRVNIKDITKKQIDKITDLSVKETLENYLKKNKINGDKPFSNLEYLPHPNGTFIKKVRIKTNFGKTFKKEDSAKNMHQHFVYSGNHHLDVWINKETGDVKPVMITNFEQKINEVYSKIGDKILKTDLKNYFEEINNKNEEIKNENDYLFSLRINDIVFYEGEYNRVQRMSVEKNGSTRIYIRKTESATTDVGLKFKGEFHNIANKKIKELKKKTINILGHEK